jgi:hypothetical protein
MTEIVDSTEIGVQNPETGSRLNMLSRELSETDRAFRELLDHLEKRGFETEKLRQELLFVPEPLKKLAT